MVSSYLFTAMVTTVAFCYLLWEAPGLLAGIVAVVGLIWGVRLYNLIRSYNS